MRRFVVLAAVLSAAGCSQIGSDPDPKPVNVDPSPKVKLQRATEGPDVRAPVEGGKKGESGAVQR